MFWLAYIAHVPQGVFERHGPQPTYRHKPVGVVTGVSRCLYWPLSGSSDTWRRTPSTSRTARCRRYREHTSEVGRVDDLIAWVRVVLHGREDGTVYGRSLRQGERDDGRRIHVRPGEQLVFEPGALAVSLDEIDRREPATETGHVNLAPVIWAWLQLSPPAAESVRYVLAAARRLDAANRLLLSVQQAGERLSADAEAGDVPGPVLRRHFADMLSSVEMLAVALGRVTDMVCSAGTAIGCTVPVAPFVDARKDAVRALRNAYEHIEDRALGQVNGRPDPRALTIFDYEPLLKEDVLAYGEHRLGVTDEIPRLLADIRQFVKDVVSGPGTAPTPARLVGACCPRPRPWTVRRRRACPPSAAQTEGRT
jgi:hypothetical protein